MGPVPSLTRAGEGQGGSHLTNESGKKELTAEESGPALSESCVVQPLGREAVCTALWAAISALFGARGVAERG